MSETFAALGVSTPVVHALAKRNIHAPATIRQRSRNVMEVEGCALAGLLCKEQRWTRVS